LADACAAPTWDQTVGRALAAGVVSKAGRDATAQPVVQGAAQVCPGEFPAGSLKRGPGFVSGGG